MLREEHLSEEFRALFLLQFTKELIKHSVTTEIEFEIEEEKKEDTIKEKVKDVLKKESESKKERLSAESMRIELEGSAPLQIVKPKKRSRFPIPKQIRPVMKRPVIRPLRIPEPRFPQRLQYLKPIPTNKEIDLDKLDSLIKDPAVKSIQCDGAGQNIIVIGSMGMKRTNIILTKEEVDGILGKFSEASKIPIQEGMFRVAVGGLILLAIVSEVISSRFIIRKMMYSPGFAAGGQPQNFEQEQRRMQEQARLQRQIFPRK